MAAMSVAKHHHCTYLGLLLFLFHFEHVPQNAVLLDPIAVFQRMFVGSSRAIVLPIGAIAIHSLDRIEASSIGAGLGQAHHSLAAHTPIVGRNEGELPGVLLALHHIAGLGGREKVVVVDRWRIRNWGRWSILAKDRSGPREVFGDLDLDVAQITLSSLPFAFLLVWVLRLGCTRRSAFHPAVKVMGNQGFALVFLSGTMGVNIVDVREIRLEPAE